MKPSVSGKEPPRVVDQAEHEDRDRGEQNLGGDPDGIAEGLEAVYPPRLRHLASFSTGDAGELARSLDELLALSAEERAELGAAARRAAVDLWSWAGVARRLLEPFD